MKHYGLVPYIYVPILEADKKSLNFPYLVINLDINILIYCNKKWSRAPTDIKLIHTILHQLQGPFFSWMVLFALSMLSV